MSENNFFKNILRKCTNYRDCYNTQFDECSRLQKENKKLQKMNQGLEKTLTMCSNVSFDRICKLTKCLQKSSNEIDTLKNELTGKDEVTRRVAIETAEKCQAQLKRIIEEYHEIIKAQTAESDSDAERYSTTSSNNQKNMDSSASSLFEVDSSARSSVEIDSSTRSSVEIGWSARSSVETDSSARSSVEIDSSARSSAEIDSSARSSVENDSSARSSVEIDSSARPSAEIDSSARSSVENDSSARPSAEIDSSSTRSSPCEVDEAALDNSMENDMCFENECGAHEATEDLLRSIDECCCSNEPCDPKQLLEKCKTAICSIMDGFEAQNVELKRYKLDNELYLRKLHEEQKISADKRSEICAIKAENVLLTNRLEQTNKLRTDDQLKEELKNTKYCLEMRMEENKRLENELCQIKQRLEDSEKINEQLECDIGLAVRKLENCEALKKVSNTKYNDLTAKYSELQYDLAIERQEKIENSKTIDDLCRKAHYLEGIIDGLNSKLLLNAEESEKLKAEKRALENKCNEMEAVERELHCEINSLKRELKNDKLELDSRDEHIKMLNEGSRKQRDRIKSLECDVENLEKERRCYEAKIEKLEVTNRKNEIDLKEASDSYEELMNENNRIACENEELEKNIIKLCKHTQSLQYKQADLERKNDELVIAHCALEEDKRKLAEDIDELNEELRCTRGNEIETEKNLLASEKNLSVACKEIDNLKLSIKCYEKSAQKGREKLRCVEQQLRDTEMRQLDNEYMAYGRTRECAKCEEAEIAAFQLSSKHDELLLENERLTMANALLCDKTRYLDEDVQTLRCANEELTGKVESYEGTRRCQSDIGLQTDPWVECPSIDVVCDHHGSSDPAEACDSCSSSATAVKTATKCDCGDGAADNELLLETNRLLRCELEEMKRLCEQNEAIAERKRIEMEWDLMRCRNELDSQTAAKVAELNVKLEMYATSMKRLEKDLKDSQTREETLKKDSAEFAQTIQMQDKLLKEEVEKNKMASMIEDDAKEYSDFDEESISDDENSVSKVGSKTVHEKMEIVTRPTADSIPASLSSKKIGKNEKKSNGVEVSHKKINRKEEKEKHRKPLTYGPRLDLPCCIGSENPCDRQKKLSEKWRKNCTSDMQRGSPILAVIPSTKKSCKQPAASKARPPVLPKCEFPKEMIALLREELNRSCGLPVSTIRC